MERYRYSPLAPNNIRVLKLLPGREQEPLTVEIGHVDLATRPHYEALSYEWGAPETKMTNRVNNGLDSYLPITVSLRNALRSLRSPESMRTIWADAICINQLDDSERTQQVLLMGSIYQAASVVVTYIGEETDDTRHGLSLGYQILEYVHRNSKSPPDPRLVRTNDDLVMLELGFPPVDHPHWKALRSLTRRTWSTRAWMVQESLLNKNMKMLCGRVEINWYTLPDIARFTSEYRSPILAITSHDETTASVGGLLKPFWQ